MFRKAVAENDKFHGANYPYLLNSILSVGEDGVYFDSLRFIFELIQNVDDCDYADEKDRMLDIVIASTLTVMSGSRKVTLKSPNVERLIRIMIFHYSSAN